MLTNPPLDEMAQRFPFLCPDPDGFRRGVGAAEPALDERAMREGLLERSVRFVTLLAAAHVAARRNAGLELSRGFDEHLARPSLQGCVRLQSHILAHDADALVSVFGLPLRNPAQVRLFLDSYRALLIRLDQFGKTVRSEEALQVLLEEYTDFLCRHFHSRLVSLREEGKGLAAFDVATGERMSVDGILPKAAVRGLHLVDDLAETFVPLDPLFLFREGALCAYAGLDAEEGVRYIDGGGRLLARAERDDLLGWAEFFAEIGAYRRALTVFHGPGKNLFPHKERTNLYRYVRLCASGMEHMAQEEYPQAVEEFRRALDMDDSHPPLYYILAHAHRRTGGHDEAVAVLRRMLDKYPDKPHALELLGDLFAERNSPEALRFYERVVKANPNLPGVARKMNDVKERLAARSAAPAAEGLREAPVEGARPLPGGLPSAPARKPDADSAQGKDSPDAPPLDELLVDMTSDVERGRCRPVVGREAERAQFVEILCCEGKRNVLLLGDSGVGKTALVEDFALRLARGDVPRALRGKRLFMFNAAAAIAGAKYRGQFEERVMQVLRELRHQPSILFLDDVHALAGMGLSKGGSIDLVSLLKTPLLRGEIQAVAASTSEEHRARLEKDPTLSRCFQNLRLEEPSREETLAVLVFRKDTMERHHRVRLNEELFAETLQAVALCLKERAFPDKALDVYDRAAAKAALRANGGVSRAKPSVSAEDVYAAVADLSSVPVAKVAGMRESRYRDMEALLEERIIGQSAAVKTVARALRTAKMNFALKPQRPEGVFLFVGPTGVGKTELARAMAEVLYGDADKMIRIDMSEYMERISTSRLIGAAPGYVGYNDPNQLTDLVRRNPYSLILLDEIEKADPQVMNLFLQVFDAGRMTDGRGRTVHFNHCTIVMTGNVGTELYSQMRIGYDEAGGAGVSPSALMKRVKSAFAPEFLNRVDEVVFFDPLRPEHVSRIADLKLAHVRRRLAEEGKTLHLSPSAYEALARGGFSAEFGARHMERVLRRNILDPLAEAALLPEWDASPHVLASAAEGRIRVTLHAEPPASEKAEAAPAPVEACPSFGEAETASHNEESR